nr:NAD-dependent epimerase/dehydratase family protein [uncultured Pedobacter sp.]
METIYNSNIDWKKFYNRTILITGANGVLPAYLVESLLYLNFLDSTNNVKVIALVRNLENAKQRFVDYLNNPNLDFIIQDVSDQININQKIDFIIHAASQASPKFYGIDPVGTLKANVLGTLNLLDLAVKHNVLSFLYFSSAEIYGEVDYSLIPIKEDTFGYLDPTNVRSCYAESKRMGENICVSYFKQYKVPTKSVRPFHTYGPGMKLDDGRVYADFVANVLENKNIEIKSDGSSVRAFCYITDSTIGFLKVLLDGIDGESYNIGNPNEEYSILELATIVINIFPEKMLKLKTKVDSTDTNYLKSPFIRNSPDISKMKSLGWIPKVDVKAGFKRTILSYQ